MGDEGELGPAPESVAVGRAEPVVDAVELRAGPDVALVATGTAGPVGSRGSVGVSRVGPAAEGGQGPSGAEGGESVCSGVSLADRGAGDPTDPGDVGPAGIGGAEVGPGEVGPATSGGPGTGVARRAGRLAVGGGGRAGVTEARLIDAGGAVRSGEVGPAGTGGIEPADVADVGAGYGRDGGAGAEGIEPADADGVRAAHGGSVGSADRDPAAAEAGKAGPLTGGRAASADTDPSAPMDADRVEAVAAALFGDRVEKARRYADLLVDTGVSHGLIGPREADRVWSRHILNCAVLAELVEPEARVLDIGSGAGLPGIPLALARPDLEIVLLEPLARRVEWLRGTLDELGLAAVVVARGRAEESAVRRRWSGADVVTARAVAPLARLAGWALPLLRPGGRLLAVKGASAAEEVTRDRAAVRDFGGATPRVVQCGGTHVDPPTTVVEVERTASRVRSGGARRTRG